MLKAYTYLHDVHKNNFKRFCANSADDDNDGGSYAEIIHCGKTVSTTL